MTPRIVGSERHAQTWIAIVVVDVVNGVEIVEYHPWDRAVAQWGDDGQG